MRILTLVLCLYSSFACAKPLNIGIEGAYPPFSSVDEKGELIGFDVDIAKALCQEMKRECAFQKVDWDGLIPSLVNENIDAVIASMTANEERKQMVDFTDKYYSNIGKLVAQKQLADKLNEQNLAEVLKGKVLGVQSATVHDVYASEKLADIVKIERYNTQDDANVDLAAGRIDATLGDQIALNEGFLKTDLGKDFAYANIDFKDEAYYGSGISIAVRKDNEALKTALNQAIKTIRENGTYQKIAQKYFSFDIY